MLEENKQNSSQSMLASDNKTSKTIKKKNRAITALSITTALLALSTTGLAIGLGISEKNSSNYQDKLENVYQSNFYSLLDSVNNLDNKLSKLNNSSSSSYQRKLLLEASSNASEAEISIASLPLSQNDIQDTVKMVNQISGYTTTLADKLAQGQSLTDDDMQTLEKVSQSVSALKIQLNEFARKLDKGYQILDASMDMDADGNRFSTSLSSLKNNDVEYPTMIYDGPFSDSVVNSNIKGVTKEKVSKEKAQEHLESHFKSASSIEYVGSTEGRFQTYNYRVTNSSEEKLYVQSLQQGGDILTISGAGELGQASIDDAEAKNIALEFAKLNGIENGQVVWSDTIENDIYFNIAPTQNSIILYPDLVKVKVNLVSGTVVGYDATAYFTNHTDRSLSKGSLTLEEGENKVPERFTASLTRFALVPLDYNREVVCVEVQAEDGESTFYFYYNATSGVLENVLKVIKTDNGNLLL